MKAMISRIFASFFLGCTLISAGTSSVRETESSSPQDDLVKINDSLFSFSGEITNLEYRIYLNQTKRRNDLDTFNWANGERTWIDYSITYHHSKIYDRMPVVNIKWSSANSYCQWKEVVLQMKYKNKKVTVRLPDREEWLTVAGYQFQDVSKRDSVEKCQFFWGTYSVYDAHASQRANFRIPLMYRTTIQSEPLMDVKSFLPAPSGLYGVHGNAAEMINVNGVCLGGGWNDNPEMSMPNKMQYYNQSSSEVGFRPIVIMK